MGGRRLWSRTRRELRQELDEEIAYHVERRTGELMARGHDAAGARAEALRRFGDVQRTTEVCVESDVRRERRLERRELLADFGQDVRLGLRQLLRRPGFSLLAVATLGVAIGAAAAIYAVADHVLVRPLPYDAPARIVTLWEVPQEGGRAEVSPGTFVDWRERARSFSVMGIAEPWSVDLTGSGAPQVLRAWAVTEGFLEALGARAAIGRGFAPEDYTSPARVALLSWHSWQERFGGDRTIVGRTLTLDGSGVEIIGVLPPSVEYPAREEVWLPKQFRPDELADRRSAYMHAVARLATGVTVEQAQSEMNGIAAALGREHSASQGRGVLVKPLSEEVLGEARPIMAALLLATVLLLLIACANVANLLVSRGLERSGEMAVRGALGAGRMRLVRQLMSESLVLSVCAGALGLVLAHWWIQLLVALAPAGLPRISAVSLDLRVVTFLAVLTIAAGALFGSLPALRLSRPDLMGPLRGSSAGRSQEWLRRALVAGEVAFCFMLLIGAGLLTRSLLLLTENELGFETSGRASAQAFLWDNNPTPQQRVVRVREMIARMEALPGVHSAAAVTALPFHPHAINSMGGLLIEGEPTRPDDAGRRVLTTVITPRYFETMQIPLKRGRTFSHTDGPDSPPVVIVNDALARTFFPGADPIGRRIRGGVMGPPVTREIVGVVAAVRQSTFDTDPAPELFVPHAQNASGSITFVAHGAGREDVLLSGMRSAIWSVDPAQTLYYEATLPSLINATLAQRTFQLTLTAAFGALALLLVVLGVYGVMSLWVRERRREIGIRVALGARTRDVNALILRQALFTALPGLVTGAALAALSAAGLERTLYGISSTDTTTYVATTLLLLGAAAAAAWIPARNASRSDPARSIRSD